MNNEVTQKPTLKLVFTNEFGDRTEIEKTMISGDIGDVFRSIRDMLMGCGFQKANVDEWFPEE